MVTYSVSISIEKAIAQDWQEWMLAHHIPEVMATGCFTQFALQKLLDPISDESSVTFNVQYRCPSRKTLELYQSRFAPALQKSHTERYAGRFVAFRSVLEVIQG